MGTPPALRFNMDATLETLEGEVQVVAWDQAVKQMRAAGLRARVKLASCTPNPLLTGWWTCTGPVLAASATEK